MAMVEEPGEQPGLVNHVVITVHGIRTFGQWQERLGRLLPDGPRIQFAHYHYGYFSIVAFLIPVLRWLVTRRFRAELLRVARNHPGARVDIIAHSFGTHLVAHGLAGIPQGRRPKIHTVILAGSVLNVGFPWRELMDKGTVHRLVNDCGIVDKILMLNQFVVLFTGMAGRVGFVGMTDPERFVNRYFGFGHSGYFEKEGQADDEFMRGRWVPLLTGTDPPEPADERVGGSALVGLQVFLLNSLEPIKLSIYMTPVVLLALLYYGLYRGERQARSERDQQFLLSQRNLRESLFHEAQALRQTTANDRRYQALSALDRAARLDVGARDEVAEVNLRSEYLRSLDVPGMLPGPRHPDARYSLILGSGGRLIAIPEKGPPGEFHPESGKLLRSFPGLGQVSLPAALDPEGKRIAFLSPDKSHLAVQEIDGGRVVNSPDDPGAGEIISIAFGPGAIATAARTGVRDVWAIVVRDSTTLAVRSRWTTEALHIDSLRFDPAGRILVASAFILSRNTGGWSQHVIGWTALDGKSVLDLVLEQKLHNYSPDGGSDRVNFSPDGRVLAASGFAGTVALWKGDSRQNLWKEIASIHAHDTDARVVRFSTDGLLLATANTSSVQLLDGESGHILASAKLEKEIYRPSLLWAGDNTLVLACPFVGVGLWKVDRPLSRLARPHVGERIGEALRVKALRFSRSDRWLAIGYDQSSPGVIDLKQPDKTPTPLEGLQRARALAFSPTEDDLLGSDLSSSATWSLHPETRGKLTRSHPDFTRVGFELAESEGVGTVVAGTESALQFRLVNADGQTAWRHVERGTFLGSAALLVGPGSKSAISGHLVPSGEVSMIWDFETGKISSRRPVRIDAPFFMAERPMALSSSGADDKPSVVDLTTGEIVKPAPADDKLSVVDLTTGEIVKPAPDELRPRDSFWNNYVISGDGSLCAESSILSPVIELWEIKTGRLRAAIRRGGIPDGRDLKAISYDGKMLATRDAADIVVWGIGGEGVKEVGRIHAEPVALGFGGPGGDEKSLLVVDKAGHVLEWRPGLEGAKPVCRLDVVNTYLLADWHLTRDRSGAVLRSRQGRGGMNVSVYDLRSGKRLRQWDLVGDEMLDVAPDSEGGRLFVADTSSTLKVWERRSGKELMSLGPMEQFARQGMIRFSADGGYLSFVEMTTPETVKIPAKFARRVVKIGATGRGEVVDAAVETPIGPVAVSSGASLVASGSGNMITVSRPGSAGKSTVLSGHDDRIVDLDIDAGGLLASASSDRTVRLWKAGEGRLLLVLDAGPGRPNCVALSPSGTWLAVGDEDGNVRFWDLAEARRRLGQAGLDWN